MPGPVAGDRRYGSSMPSPRMLLNAWKLEHVYFGGELVAPVPADFPPLVHSPMLTIGNGVVGF